MHVITHATHATMACAGHMPCTSTSTRTPAGHQDKESADPNRVGGPVNHLLGDGGMGTTIARMPNDGGLSFQLARTQARTNTRDRPIQEAQRQISDICNR
jgi:hypothetical protein